MDAVDVSDHYEVITTEETPSLLAIILDTNPRAWAALGDRLPLSKAVANMLVFVNAHLAFSNANQVALIAAHVDRSVWLYPAPPPSATADKASTSGTASANKYPHFAHIESTVTASIRHLIDTTNEAHLAQTTTHLSGALTLALCYINKAAQALSATTAAVGDGAQANNGTTSMSLKGRILVISVSDSEPSQYIPTMNAVFAAAHARVAIDALALAGDQTFLQQACFNTDGIFLVASKPQGMLTYLMFGLIADTEARKSLVTPTHDKVDFRAACFCHAKVVDTGFVCSICLSIFCELPPDAECLTCGTKLALGKYGSKPAVVPRRKKKKKRVGNGSVREETGSATGTPRP
ncbi:hypothetical protein CDD81_1176 [Ophiocordyceps australis]|uniref:General transcription and DNA repair factor IIH subunit TFB4 n=1 Tax=Ophiocordyceps australis TaxID=1399860 RepID=A0A2C5X866_9HYPO|nr:hypothetical protein CDD81_1176 [Ophiocordyceps australis]